MAVPLRVLACAALLIFPSAAAIPAEELSPPAYERRGPLEMRIQNSISLMFPRLPKTPVRTADEPWRLEARIDYSSIFKGERSLDGSDLVIQDGELLRTELLVGFAPSERAEIFALVGAHYGWGGFLDGLIESYHDLLGFPQGGRDKNPDNQFAMLLSLDDRLAYSLEEETLGLGDLLVGASWMARREDDLDPGVRLSAGVELPTGDEERGFGNGGTDYALGLMVEKGIGTWVLYGAFDFSILEPPQRFRLLDVPIQDGWSALFAAERPYPRGWSLLAQLYFETSPVDGTGLKDADEDAWFYAVGAVFDVGERSRLEVGILEDITGEISQDITLRLAYRGRF